MQKKPQHIYIIGYGNRFRQDDALGPELAETLRLENIPGVTVADKHHLSIDDAYDIAMSGAGIVIFIDASLSGDEPFSIDTVKPVVSTSLSLSLTTPGTILYLCEKAFNKKVRGYIIGIRGYEWDFSSDISNDAFTNSSEAYHFIRDIIEVFLNNSFSFVESVSGEGCWISE